MCRKSSDFSWGPGGNKLLSINKQLTSCSWIKASVCINQIGLYDDVLPKSKSVIEKMYHFPPPVCVDGDCSQLKQWIPSCVLQWRRKLSFLTLTPSAVSKERWTTGKPVQLREMGILIPACVQKAKLSELTLTRNFTVWLKIFCTTPW